MTEVEYMAVVEASKEALWLRGLVDVQYHTGFSSGSLRQAECYSSR